MMGREMGQGAGPVSRSPLRLHILIVIVLGIAVYGNTLDVPFVFDDAHNIVDNPRVTSPANLSDIFLYPAGNLASRPLTLASLALNYRMDGFRVAGYHLVNVTIHIAAACALYILTLRTLSRLGMDDGRGMVSALIAALIFVVHPLHTESVTYIVTRSMPLAGLFYLMGLLVLESADRIGRSRAVTMMFAVSLMGMASREDFVTFPAIALLYDYVFLSGFTIAGLRRRIYVHLAAWLTLPYLIYASFAYSQSGGHAMSDYTMQQYFLAQCRTHLTYLRLLIFPIGQNLDYDYRLSASVVSVVGYVMLWASGAWLLYRKRVAGFVILWFMTILTPASSVIPLNDLIFEHRVYIAMAAPVAALAAYGLGRNWKPVIFVWLIALLAIASYARNSEWHDAISIWSDVTEKSPGKSRGYVNLGIALKDAEEDAEAEIALRKGIGINAEDEKAYYNLGYILRKRGDYDEAIGNFEAAIRIRPDMTEALQSLGRVYLETGRPALALKYYDDASRHMPGNFELANDKGVAYRAIGDHDNAVREFEEALSIRPGSAGTWYNLGKTYCDAGRFEEAARALSKTIELSPGFVQAYDAMGDTLDKLGEPDKARIIRQRAMTLKGQAGSGR